MADPTTPSVKTPWHLWVVGALSFLWNLVGAFDFFMTETRNAAYMKAFTPEQLAYFYSFPFWVVAAWAVGTWGSALGSLLLLVRRSPAAPVFAVSLAGMLLTFTHNFILTDGLKAMGGKGPGPVIFSGVIMLIGVLLLLYARAMRKRGVLR